MLHDNLLTCLVAHIRYLQEEYSGLLVGSQFGGKTKSAFRSLQKNTSNFTPETIDNLKTAVTLTQNSSQPQAHWNANFRSFRGANFRGNSFRGCGRGVRGTPFFNPSYGAGYQQRSIPTSREQQGNVSNFE